MKDTATRDDIYQLIASERLYADLRTAPLAEPGQVFIFPSSEAAAFRAGVLSARQPAPVHGMEAGSHLRWDGKAWKVLNVGETAISLLGEGEMLTEVPISAFESLAKAGRIQGVSANDDPTPSPEAVKQLLKASERDLKLANYRYGIVCQFLRGKSRPEEGRVPPRTLRR